MLRLLSLLILLAILSSPVWVLALALERLPRVLNSASLSVDDVANAQRLLRENDPRWLRDGERKRVVVTEREVNLMTSYALPGETAARVGLTRDFMTVVTSIPVPANPLGSYLNAEVILAQDGPRLEPIAANVGRMNFPAWMAVGLYTLADGLLKSRVPEYDAVLESVESIQIDDGRLAVSYQWRAGLLEQLKDRGQQLAIPEAQHHSTLAYYASLGQIAGTLRPGASLAGVLGPLFARAAQRSEEGADPGDENRALILALGMVFQGADPNRLVAEGDAPVPGVRRMSVTLRGRRDLAQHFVISAALAIGGGGRLADAIGVFKELSDSRGGSGFSFPDLLADRAGVVFAERLTGSGAREFQRRLADAKDESLFMPPIDQLPEGLQDIAFRGRYEDLDTEAYAQVRSEVEQRIQALALYQ